MDIEQLDKRIAAIEAEIATAANDLTTVDAVRGLDSSVLGKTGTLGGLIATVKDYPREQRGQVGKTLNAAKGRIRALLDDRLGKIRRADAAAETTCARAFDPTLPGVCESMGSVHPVTAVQWEIERSFERLGFTVEAGPEMETEYNNFEALNIPATHPARDMQDTFWVKSDRLESRSHRVESDRLESDRLESRSHRVESDRVESDRLESRSHRVESDRLESRSHSVESDRVESDRLESRSHSVESDRVESDRVESRSHRCVLRTHTSPVQHRAMLKFGAPLRVIAPGRCFRYETVDASHETTFHQVEGLMIDRDISIPNLIAMAKTLLIDVMRREVELRVRPGYFPFVEPGLEIDMNCQICGGTGCPTCKQSGWLEIMPCGMVHPAVLSAGKIDPDEYTGFAFGLGLTRLAMMKYGIPDIRVLNGGDIRPIVSPARLGGPIIANYELRSKKNEVDLKEGR